jgi:putative endonuclease
VGSVHEYYVYILSSVDGSCLYVGVTSEMGTRLKQHGTGSFKGYTSATDACILRYYEKHKYIRNAIAQEKHIKSLSREKKIALIESVNPEWRDLTTIFVKEG